MGKRLTQEQKNKVVMRYQKGEAIRDLCIEYGVSNSSIYHWIHLYNETASTDKNATGLHLINLKVQKLEQILAIRNLTNCTPTTPLKDRLYELERLKDQYSVHILCEALDVDRGTFYNHLYRRKQTTTYQKREEMIGKLVEEIFHQSNQTFGAKKIASVLKSRDIVASPTYVRKS